MNFKKMIKKKFKSFVLLTVIFFFACEEEVKPPETDAEDLLVVNSVIAPSLSETVVQVSISQKSFGIISNEFGDDDIISNAIVRISDGTNEVQLTFNNEFQYYSVSAGSFPIQDGGRYSLSVEAQGKTVTAETTVPRKVENIESYKLDQRDLNVVWKDISESENYYRVTARGYVEEFRFWNIFFFDEDEFRSDTNKDGQLLSAKAEIFSFGQQQQYDSLEIQIISSSELYFDYFEILRRFEGDDPFSDPVRLPTNINGGLGIFTAVQVTEIREEL